MWKQIKLLSALQLCNVFGINEARYSRDPKKRKRLKAMAYLYVFLILMMGFYVGGLAYGFIFVGIGDIIPLYLSAMTSMVILIFTIFRAGPVLFNLKTYDATIVLPVKATAIVISRFFTMYLVNWGLSLLVLLPGTLVSGIFLKPAFSFYAMMLLGAFFLPLIPMTLAMIMGALIYGVSSRMRYKNLAIILLSILVVLIPFLFPLLLPNGSDTTEKELVQLISVALTQAGSLYPPAEWFSNSIEAANWGSYLLFGAGSVGFFSLISVIIGWKFKSICTALSSHKAKRNYVMAQQRRRSILWALYGKELRRYLASSIYVINTSIGYILAVLISAGVLFVGTEVLLKELPLPEGLEVRLIPFLMAAVCAISPTTTSAISIEGKQWWVAKTLPVQSEVVFNSKILVNLTVALPCYVLSTIFLCLGLKPTGLDLLWLILMPLIYIVFTVVLGLIINIKMPMLSWESETVPVKQSKAMLITMLLGFVSVIIPVALLLVLPTQWHALILFGVGILLIALTVAMYRWSRNIRLVDIG